MLLLLGAFRFSNTITASNGYQLLPTCAGMNHLTEPEGKRNPWLRVGLINPGCYHATAAQRDLPNQWGFGVNHIMTWARLLYVASVCQFSGERMECLHICELPMHADWEEWNRISTAGCTMQWV
mmetsp:Transcript_20658/g.39225  ORF Transcript_20658/g.39225 Transcript_20658/m.39225 type:complete len:124 (-) Transcript_20658:69-440(-)